MGHNRVITNNIRHNYIDNIHNVNNVENVKDITKTYENHLYGDKVGRNAYLLKDHANTGYEEFGLLNLMDGSVMPAQNQRLALLLI
mmetsp:Transcript_17996/g.30639  ORF Transcript_17996/g.30639 Transcript_17996/m.30639 type:complete len:86 (-) Transcript_17996:78-335(-)|eukprot:CAMPEP_0168611476 /NCGR_PEP_ID=MMETSP0449_2-20121227/2379_1 /TAXON_ID=1082188 /ORGANISM="Strombidium rassoulzadegani, Strain ras09" /LENGTH=85 /DNA_ID=CAMNT_0008651927 /DNA_START=27 /DNA_END=284 /DNA_ORIENTATION=-